jgi:hypothetical protein
MTRINVPSGEPISSPLIDELERIREERISRKSKASKTEEEAVTGKDDLPHTKRP